MMVNLMLKLRRGRTIVNFDELGLRWLFFGIRGLFARFGFRIRDAGVLSAFFVSFHSSSRWDLVSGSNSTVRCHHNTLFTCHRFWNGVQLTTENRTLRGR